ncbi:hypothetical protein Tco_1370634 [Tanacetum coccineum]
MDSKRKSLIRAVMKCSNYHRLVHETKLHRHGVNNPLWCHLAILILNPAADDDSAVDTVRAEVGTTDNTDHTMAEHNQVGCKLPAVEHYKPQPYAQTHPGTCPSDMTTYTPYAQSPPDVSPSYLSYHISPA